MATHKPDLSDLRRLLIDGEISIEDYDRLAERRYAARKEAAAPSRGEDDAVSPEENRVPLRSVSNR